MCLSHAFCGAKLRTVATRRFESSAPGPSARRLSPAVTTILTFAKQVSCAVDVGSSPSGPCGDGVGCFDTVCRSMFALPTVFVDVCGRTEVAGGLAIVVPSPRVRSVRVFVDRSSVVQPTSKCRSASTACTLGGGVGGGLMLWQRAYPLASKPGQSPAQLAYHFAQLRVSQSTLGRQHPREVARRLMRFCRGRE